MPTVRRWTVPLDHLRLQELSDREVLLVLVDCANGDGYADAADIGERLGLAEEHRLRATTSRLTWLMRWDAVEREPESLIEKPPPGEPRRRRGWRLTKIGQDLAMGQLRKSQEQALAQARDGDMIELTRLLAQHQRSGGTAVKNLMRREWRYRTEYGR